MKSIVPTFILIIGFTIMVMLGGSMILAQTEISAAKELHTSCLVRMQASAYSEDVYNECASEVSEMGEGWSLDPPTEVTVFKDRKAEKITMNYKITVPFMGISRTASITGYGK